MDIILISGFVLACAVAGKIVGAESAYFKVLAGAAAAVLVFMKTSSALGSVFAQIRSIFTESGVDMQYVKILFKGLGICLLTDLTYDICRDSGELALADQMLLAGKISLTILSLPLFTALTEIVKSLLN